MLNFVSPGERSASAGHQDKLLNPRRILVNPGELVSLSKQFGEYLHNNVFAHGTVTNNDDHNRVSRSKGWANWTKLTPINTFGGTS